MRAGNARGCWRPTALLVLLLGLGVLPASGAAEMPDWAVLPGVGRQDHRVVVNPNQSPWRAIGRVQTELGGRCTGFLVGPRIVVTAAHCLFLRVPQHYLQPRSVHFVTSYAFGDFAGHSRAVAFTVGPGYDPMNPAGTAGADWAVLTLARSLGTPDRILPLAEQAATGGAIALAGYSIDRPEVIEADLNCAISGRGADGEGHVLLADNCEATHGVSGAPLLVHSPDRGWQVVGIQVAGSAGRPGGWAVPASAISLGGGAAEGGAVAAPAGSGAAPSTAATAAHRSR